MILVDYSQVALAGIMQFQRDLKTGSDDKIVGLIRHVVLSSLVANKKKFSPRFGDLVICCDGKDYWRKDFFPQYKATRKVAREKSDFNWKLIFDTLSQIREELKENFPYKVIHHNRAEADDIIGVLSAYSQENELLAVGLVEDPQPVLILSSDKDNIQLQRYGNVKQYSPMQKKSVVPDDGWHKALMEKIVKGDPGDGIPNILSPDGVFLEEGSRQKPISSKRLTEFFENGFLACKNDEERRNFHRNTALVDYQHIPENIRAEILDIYKNTEIKGNKAKIMKYLMDNRCKNLMEDIENF